MRRLILLLLIIAFHFSANAITVSGTVTSSVTGQPIASHSVLLTVFDSVSGLTSIFDSTFTNSGGWYNFVFTNPNPSSLLFYVRVYDCQNNPLNIYANSSSSNLNFSICTSVVNPCQADFYFIYDSISPSTVHFFDNSTGNPTSFAWNFGDNTTSTLQYPTHTYNSNGYFMVSLTISGTTCSSTTFDTVVISSSTPCQVSISHSVDSSNANLYHFSSQVTGNPSSYLWSFGDGSTSNLANPSHLYSSVGTFHISLTISGISCTANDTTTIIIQNPCGAYFSWSANQVDPSILTFNDLSYGAITSWLWDFGDFTTSTIQNPTHSFPSPGIYTVKLKINSSNCTDSTSHNVQVNGNNSSILIYPFVGSSYLDSGKAYLYKMNLVTQGINLVDSTSLGSYSGINFFNFGGIPPGSYRVKVKPTAGSLYSNYFETWLGNTITWQNANTYVISGTSTVDYVSLITTNVILPQGNSSISGNITILDSSSITTNDEIKIYLMKPDLSIISLKILDITNSFSFTNLPYGTYKIFVEITGLNSFPFTFDLTPQSPNFEGVNIYVTNKNIVLNLGSENDHEIGLKMYPNPVKDLLNVEIKNPNLIDIEVKITGVDGRVISALNSSGVNESTLKIDVANLPSGVYYLSINTYNSSINKLFIKI